MSVDSWTACPVCYKKYKEEYNKELEVCNNLYGKVPYEDFKKIEKEHKDSIKKLLNNMKEETLREDCEFYLNKKGVLTVSYLGRCETCGIKYPFNTKIDFNKR